MASEVNVNYYERWVSAIGGGALLAVGIRNGYMRKALGLPIFLVAGHAIYRGITGRDHVYALMDVSTAPEEPGQPGVAPDKGIKVEQQVTINKSSEELYQFWHDFENLPRFMDHLEAVHTTDDGHSHWVAKAPAGASVAWDAEVVEDRPNEFIAWRSLAGADVPNAGSVRFRPATSGHGAEVQVIMEYSPPAGILGATFAKLFGEEPNQQVAGDLRRFKNLMETGEIPTTEGQSSGPR